MRKLRRRLANQISSVAEVMEVGSRRCSTPIRIRFTARRQSWSNHQWSPPVQREMVYPSGKYALYGDGLNQAYQWVWIQAPVSPPTPPQ